MNSKSLRRLAADHGSLQTAGLPPNYLFPPTAHGHDPSSDLTSLDVLLTGPVGTPFAAGVWKLHLDIPPTYPAAPPTAAFRTRIWHPNVEEATGAVCVDTLKRDWSDKLRLRDVLVTISCLLIQPNPASALNAEAGKLAAEDWDGFCRRARLMAGIHAGVPPELRELVKEAQRRGEEVAQPEEKGKEKVREKETPKKRKQKQMQDVAVEEEENLRQGDERAEDSDPESDWIPGPVRAPEPLGAGRDNIFGIRTGTPAGMDGEDRMDLDTPKKNAASVSLFGAMGAKNGDSTMLGLDLSAPLPVLPASGSSRLTRAAKADADPFTADDTQGSSFRALRTLHFNVPPPASSSKQTTKTQSTPLKFIHQAKPAPIQPPIRSQSQSFPTEFSWSWADSEIIHNTGTIVDGPSVTEVQKRLREPESLRRERNEMKRFRAAGSSLLKYNRGVFGPRKGLHRL
ncbi:UBC-like protein [Glonium stellatum]|uniref:UBC-like protein n=1 Tax=Glonium stellatum TaxID=574774 RepID=A0A8E2FAB2_9PEZI|nr:UBC-like protein [Glonium stellatum]